MFLSEWREFPSAPSLAEKKIWWQLASRCCWNNARPWHASELDSFLVGLRTYQHPVYIKIANVACFFYPKYPDQIWGPPSLLFSGYSLGKSVATYCWQLTSSQRRSYEWWSNTTTTIICLRGVDRDNFTFFINTQFHKGRTGEEEDVSSYGMTLRKREGSIHCKRKH